MTRRAGLTLLEVVLSIVLLTLVAATCLPLLAGLSGVAARDVADADLRELELLVDDALKGLGPEELAALPGEGVLPGTEGAGWNRVRYRRLAPARREVEHVWYAFGDEQGWIVRWIPRPEAAR